MTYKKVSEQDLLEFQNNPNWALELVECDLCGIDLGNIFKRHIGSLHFCQCLLDGANFSNSEICRTRFLRCSMKSTVLSCCRFSDSYFSDCDLTNASFAGSASECTRFYACDFSRASLRGASFESSIFYLTSSWKGADLSNGNFMGSDIKHTGAICDASKLHGAQFRPAHFEGEGGSRLLLRLFTGD